MRRNDTVLVFVCCLFWFFGFGQKEIALKGKVVSGGVGIQGVRVMNLVSEKVTVSDANGDFSIQAKEDDLLIFSHDAFEYKRRSLDSEDIKTNGIEVALIRKATELDEVVVNQNVSSEQLGVQGMKEYSTAEKRQREAGGINRQMHEDYLKYGGIPIGAIINQITGKTKTMQKYVRTEKQELLFEKLSAAYEDNYFIGKLKIKREYLDGFKFYLVQDHYFGLVFEEGNRQKIEREMAVQAMTFNDYLNEALRVEGK